MACGCSRSQRTQRPRDQHIPRVPGTRQREGARPGREEGGAWPRTGGGLEEGLSRAASGSGGSALPRLVHLGESCSRERSSETSAATAMRGARGAWDLLCVLFVLLRGQTGGRARPTRGLHPPPRGHNPGSGRGVTRRGASRVVAVGFSTACVLQPVRRWRAAAGLCWSASLTCARSRQRRAVETRSRESSGSRDRGAAGCGLVWRCFCAD